MKPFFSLLLLICISFNSFAGTGIINGKVIDEKGDVLIGATVMIEGGSQGVKTDLDGKFTLRKKRLERFIDHRDAKNRERFERGGCKNTSQKRKYQCITITTKKHVDHFRWYIC
jgi:hypothetical protein